MSLQRQDAAMSDPQEELAALRRQLAEATATLEAIRTGGVDALVVRVGGNEEVFTLESSELPYRDFIEHMEEGALSLGPAFEVLYCNRFLCNLIGIGRNEILGSSIMRWLDAQSQQALIQAAGAMTASTVMATILRAGSHRVPTLMSVVPASSGRSRRCNIVVSDQRATHHLQQVTKAHDAAKAESHAKDRFLAVLGHELRNPLAALANSISVLREVPLEGEQLTNVYTGMSRQVHQLTSLVDDLLDMTRVAQGKVVLKPQLVTIDQLLEDALTSVRGNLEQKQQRLITTGVPEGLAVRADRVRMEQVLLNLLTNAVRYTPIGGTITVDAGVNGDVVEVSVTDTGIGIDAEHLERIFEPFAQVGEEGTGGLGIGLSLVRQLMQLHGGSVVANSAGLGSGTTVKVTLPKPKASKSAPPRAKVSDLSPGASQAALRMLIVDDNEDAADMLSLMLQRLGHDVRNVACGREVADVVTSFEPEVVLLDLGLPDISGYEVARLLRQAGHRDLIIIALTGFSHASARARTLEAGIDAHLIKPVSLSDVFEAVQKAQRRTAGA
jgi:signal transduction histidine kinase/ActR/RegA family two-component response regulator